MIAIVVACSENGVIGKDGKIPWEIPGEQKRFKNLTTGNIVIMGRKTFEEIGSPLPDRFTIVVSKTKKYSFGNCVGAMSFDEALQIALLLSKEKKQDIFIAGGERIYQEAIDVAEKIYLTLIHEIVEGDRFFKNFNKINNKIENKIENKSVDGWICEEKNFFDAKIPYTNFTYSKIKK